MAASIRETLARAESEVMIAGNPNKKKLVIPVPSFGFRNLIKARGLVSGTVFDIIGADGIGKSTLLHTILGWGLAANGPAAIIESEGKPLDRQRAETALHPDKRIASIFYDSIYREQARELREAVNLIEKWLITVRGPGSCYPKGATAIIGLDSFSKLMSPSEAAGFAVYDSKKDRDAKKADAKKKAAKAAKKGDDEESDSTDSSDESKELGTGSNFEHSKLTQEWSRRLAYFLGKYNAILVLIRHQNDKIDMSHGGGGMMLSEEAKAAMNRTTIGGRAIHQSAAYQIVLSRLKFADASVNGVAEKVGVDVKMNLTKNNWGPTGRNSIYRLCLVPRRETEALYEPAINFDLGIPEMLKTQKLLKINVKNVNTVVVTDFNAQGRTEEIGVYDFIEQFYQRGMSDSIGKQLGFAHYDDNTEVAELIATHVPELVLPDAEAEDAEAPKITT